MNEKLARCPIVVEFPVGWGDMDAVNHVNNAVYFRYFEHARVAYFDKLGWLKQREKTGIGPILASVQCAFKAPLTYPDTVLIGAHVSHIEIDRITMQYFVFSHKLQRIAAEGEGIVVSYDYGEGKKVPLPKEIKDKIKALEAATKSA